MRLTRVLLAYRRHAKNPRAPQNPNRVPFQPILPLKLRDKVSGKVDSMGQVACLHELSVLFAAMKTTEFNEKQCTKEIEALKNAHIEAMNTAREQKLKNSGQISTIGRMLNSKQLNRYLKKFPN